MSRTSFYGRLRVVSRHLRHFREYVRQELGIKRMGVMFIFLTEPETYVELSLEREDIECEILMLMERLT